MNARHKGYGKVCLDVHGASWPRRGSVPCDLVLSAESTIASDFKSENSRNGRISRHLVADPDTAPAGSVGWLGVGGWFLLKDKHADIIKIDFILVLEI